MKWKFKSAELVESILLGIIIWHLPEIPQWKWILYLFSIIGITLEWEL